MTQYLISSSSALLVTLLLIPPTIALARAFGLLDAPDAARRLHCSAVPRLGGLAVWAGAFVGVVAAIIVPALAGLQPLHALDLGEERLAVGLFAGVGLMIAAGFVDDVRGLRPSHKFAVQLVAAAFAMSAGFRIDSIALPGTESLDLGLLALPATLLWLVGVTNAFNLIDGLDGLAGGVALVGLATVGVAGVLLGNDAVLALAVPLAAGIAGFLRFNTARPSRIFLGDVGSLSIGFALAVLTVEGARRPQGDVIAVVPLFALAFPLFDTAISMLRRWLRGVPLSGADGRHVHHQLVCLGLSRGRAAAVICMFSGCVAAMGLSLAFAPRTLTLTLAILAGAAGLLFVIHGLRWLGYHEFVEAQASFTSGLYKARGVVRDRILARELEVRIRNVSSYAALEVLLAEAARTFNFAHIALSDPAGLRAEDPTFAATHRLMRLERPVAVPDAFGDDCYVFRVWWNETGRNPHLYAERIVRMLAPAIEAGLAQITRPADARLVATSNGEVAQLLAPSVVPGRTRRARSIAKSR